MRIGYAQFTPSHGQVARNRDRLLQLVASADADLLVLPELCLSGYQMCDAAEARGLAEPADGPTAAALAPLCAARGSHVVVGLAELGGDGALYNAAVVVGPGGLVGTYRKVHLFADEPDWASPGNLGFPVWELGPYRLGVMICFDYAFPEAARSLALAGADVIAQPANLVLPWCQRVTPVRALENRVYTVTANRCGTEDRTEGPALTFTGGSQIASPLGEVLAESDAQGDDLHVTEIDLALARDKRFTPRNHVLDQRRPDQYRLG